MYNSKDFSIFKIFATLSRLFIFFMLSFVWTRYFIKNLTVALLSATLITLCLDFLLRLFNKSRNKKNILATSEKDLIESCALAFLFNDDKGNIDFFSKLLKHEQKDFEKKSRYIVIKNCDNKQILLPFFTFNKFSADDLICCINQTKKENAQKLIICTNEIDSSTTRLASKISVNVIILDKESIYEKLLKPNNSFPEKKVEITNTAKMKLQDFLAYALCKKRTRGYLLASFVILLSSFIVRYNIYYVIFSTVLLLLSLVSFTNPKFNKTPQGNLFD